MRGWGGKAWRLCGKGGLQSHGLIMYLVECGANSGNLFSLPSLFDSLSIRLIFKMSVILLLTKCFMYEPDDF